MNDLMTIKEVMAAYRVGYQTVYLAAKRGEIEAYKPGSHLLLASESVEAWFKGTRLQPKKAVGRPRKHEQRRSV